MVREGERHGMCESVFKTAWERHGMCESALRRPHGAINLQQVTCSLSLPLHWPRVNRPLTLNIPSLPRQLFFYQAGVLEEGPHVFFLISQL
jgi:hypothetical protein